MSPFTPTSAPSTVKIDWTDEEIMLFLGRKRGGDPLPSNVITDVNPFSFDPWNSPDNMWYLLNSKDPVSPKGERGNKNTSSGYWRNIEHDLKIFIGSHTVGRKVTWEFVGGAAPHGDKIVWMMFEYKLEKTELQATDKALDFNSLCRIFWHNNCMPACEEPQNPVSLDDADGDYVQSALLSMLKQEEEQDLLESTYRHQGLLEVSDRSLEDSRPNNSAEIHPVCDFSNGDFLELKDLYDLESSSSSSDNSSCVSQSSDEYFDPEALLIDLENDNGPSVPSVERHHTEYKFSVSRSPRTNRVVIHPPAQSFMRDSGLNQVVMGEISAAAAPGPGPRPVCSLSIPPLNSSVGTSRSYQDNKEIGSSSQHAGRYQGSVTNRIGRLAKLGKKYFCFASY